MTSRNWNFSNYSGHNSSRGGVKHRDPADLSFIMDPSAFSSLSLLDPCDRDDINSVNLDLGLPEFLAETNGHSPSLRNGVSMSAHVYDNGCGSSQYDSDQNSSSDMSQAPSSVWLDSHIDDHVRFKTLGVGDIGIALECLNATICSNGTGSDSSLAEGYNMEGMDDQLGGIQIDAGVAHYATATLENGPEEPEIIVQKTTKNSSRGPRKRQANVMKNGTQGDNNSKSKRKQNSEKPLGKRIQSSRKRQSAQVVTDDMDEIEAWEDVRPRKWRWNYKDAGNASKKKAPTNTKKSGVCINEYQYHVSVPVAGNQNKRVSSRRRVKENSTLKLTAKDLSKNGSKGTQRGRVSKEEIESVINYVAANGFGRQLRIRNRFRAEVGRNLRLMLATFEASGMFGGTDSESMPSIYIPGEILKYFGQLDVYQTIAKGIKAITSPETDSTTEGGQKELEWKWDGWNMSPLANPFGGIGENRLYYLSKVKKNGDIDIEVDEDQDVVLIRSDEVCLFSFPNGLEVDGKPNYAPEIVSMVGSAKLNAELKILKVAQASTNVEYVSAHDLLLMRLRNPKCVGHLYADGSLVVVGVKSPEDLRIASRKFARIVQKAGNEVRLTNISMVFCIGFVKLPFKVCTAAMTRHEKTSQWAKHDRATLPGGIVFKVKETSTVCIVMDSGAMFISEVKGLEQLKATLDLMYPCIRSFAY